MKPLQFTFHVVVLILMLLGIYLIGSVIGCADDFHGKVPYFPSWHPLASGIVVFFWVSLPFVTRFSTSEFLATAAVAQVVVIAWVTFRVYCGGSINSPGWIFHGWLTWVWIYAKLLAVPFAVTIVPSVVIKGIIRRGQQSAAPLPSAPAGPSEGAR